MDFYDSADFSEDNLDNQPLRLGVESDEETKLWPSSGNISRKHWDILDVPVCPGDRPFYLLALTDLVIYPQKATMPLGKSFLL